MIGPHRLDNACSNCGGLQAREEWAALVSTVMGRSAGVADLDDIMWPQQLLPRPLDLSKTTSQGRAQT